MKPLLRAISLACALLAATPVLAVDYAEREPNDLFPPSYLPGDPVFAASDRLVGSLASKNDVDSVYLRTAATGLPGLHRYTFDLDAGGGNTELEIYDLTTTGYYLADGTDTAAGSRATFDLFDPGGVNAWGIDVYGFEAVANYALTISVVDTPVTDLGAVGTGLTARSFTADYGLASWYRFTLATAATVGADTLLSNEDADTDIALFGVDGTPLAANDDSDLDLTGYRSSLSRTLGAGTYLIAIGQFSSLYDLDEDDGMRIGWDREGFGSGDQSDSLDFTFRLSVAPVPEPGAWMALGLSAVVLARRGRRA